MNHFTLVTGAGAKDGPMGAVHSGFVEAYLLDSLQPRRKTVHGKVGLKPEDRAFLETSVDKLIAGILAERRLIGKDAERFRSTIRRAVFEQPDAHLLGVHAPQILAKLLSPHPKSHRYEILGSLLESERMIGYSMPALLISEGSGKPPPGMVYQHAGNMLRRMFEMTKAMTHVYLAGGQGTKQELIESCLLSLSRIEKGETPLQILILNQPVYNGMRLYDETMRLLEAHLHIHHSGMKLADVGIVVCHTVDELTRRLRNS